MPAQKANLTKNTQKTLQNTKKSHFFGKSILICAFFWFILCLYGCTKSPVETATDASLGQVDALQEQIKKDCPTVNYDKQINALRDSIKTQLATCESQMGQLKERNNTLLAILIGLIAVIVAFNWAKIKTKIFRR